jgi:hypothetical protein
MKWFSALSATFALCGIARAANSFAGSNLFYAAGLSSTERQTLFRWIVMHAYAGWC